MPNNYKKRKIHANFERNQVILAEAYLEILQTKNRIPTINELREKTGLVYNTIRSHIDILEKKKFAEKWKRLRVLSEQVILSQAVNAIQGGQGSAQSAKLFLEIVEEFKSGMKIDFNANINISQMTTEELLQRHQEHGKLINSKLLRFARPAGKPRRTGSD